MSYQLSGHYFTYLTRILLLLQYFLRPVLPSLVSMVWYSLSVYDYWYLMDPYIPRV